MYLDVQIAPYTKLNEIPEIARAAEEMGFSCLWAAETQHNPFLASVLVAEHTKRLKLGTAIIVSFARSPAVMAHTAWDLAEQSKGRFILGLGTQVKPHIVRRFGMPWPDSVTGKLREQMAVMRAFWRYWQENERLSFSGEYYQINLTSPFFTPSSHDHPDIPIFIAGVNIGLAKLAGEAAQGFHTHPFHSPAYLEDVIIPQIAAGAASAGRTRDAVEVVAHAFVVTNDLERQMVRQQISFYASTPSYRSVLAHHGWEEVGNQLSQMAKAQQWTQMPSLITDEMVETFATIAAPADLADALKERYNGIAERINLYLPFIPGERDDFWKQLSEAF
ncbi:MAG TPA: TIGR03617 family F420-dependent LLM class oxidoreductase [Anaerolineales bacterium]|jgi:probable F420-dependent oxidoreductase|nr:TIGR03617 family F420-dependent LLM class oxidoreductase [Anaerolineales bacterium]